MANQSVWYGTRLSEEVLNTLNDDIEAGVGDKVLGEAGVGTDANNPNMVNKQVRDTKVAWMPTTHWIAPYLMYYVDRANRENFRFDITTIDGESMQYTVYGPGKFYSWHRDDSLSEKSMFVAPNGTGQRLDITSNDSHDMCRKLSFSLLLSDPDEYEGGQFQMMGYNNKMYEVPQEKGLLVIFDSTTLHRVRPVKKGTRKSLVGWVVGPRWR
jgi:PKHD-type hydroxylase